MVKALGGWEDSRASSSAQGGLWDPDRPMAAAPRGVVQPKDGDPWNADPANLGVLGRHCAHRPHLKGSPETSLVRRQAADNKLLLAMVEHPDATVERLGEATGVSRSRVSMRLTKLSKQSLVASPMCVPGRAWCLTGAGRAAAIGMSPLHRRSPTGRDTGGAAEMPNGSPEDVAQGRGERAHGAPEAWFAGEERVGVPRPEGGFTRSPPPGSGRP